MNFCEMESGSLILKNFLHLYSLEKCCVIRYMLNLLLQVASMVGVGMNSVLVSWLVGWAAVLLLVAESGIWPVHFLDAYTAMIPKQGGDTTPMDKDF